MILSGTGHRPTRLGLTYSYGSANALKNFIISCLQNLLKIEQINGGISGGAQGFDTAYAEAMYDLGIPYEVAVPFEGQDAVWPAEAKLRYKNILDKAKKVTVVNEGGYGKKQFILRDEYMVQQSDKVLAMFDSREEGGTHHTVKYAKTHGKEVINIYHNWRPFMESQAMRRATKIVEYTDATLDKHSKMEPSAKTAMINKKFLELINKPQLIWD